jgi:hypothetical protein
MIEPGQHLHRTRGDDVGLHYTGPSREPTPWLGPPLPDEKGRPEGRPES